jgi:hypothetical protein
MKMNLLAKRQNKRWIILTSLALTLGALTGTAAAIPLPDGIGIDVTKAPYNVPNDGVTDATAALTQILARDKGDTLVLPKGIYLISDTLALQGNAKRTTWQGAGRGQTVVKLKDRCPGFDDPKKPKAMFRFGKDPAQRFRNCMFDLTVDCGAGNPGAIGVQYYTSNQGAMSRVDVVAGANSGLIGIDTGYAGEIGPGLIRQVRVNGFATGISSCPLNSMTFEHITLENQREIALFNRGWQMTVRGLTVRGAPQAVRNDGNLALIDADLSGGPGAAAVDGGGSMFIRNLRQQGWKATAICTPKPRKNQKGPVAPPVTAAGNQIKEWVSGGAAGIGPGPYHSLDLPVAEAPEPIWENAVTPFAFGAVADGKTDDTAAIQRAVDSGATTIYLPRFWNGKVNQFLIKGELVLRGKLRHFYGSDFYTLAPMKGAAATVVVGDGDGPILIERFDMIYMDLHFEIRSSRPVALSHITTWRKPVVVDGTGDVFLTDICATAKFKHPGQRVFARQINCEAGNDENLVSEGATLWVLGIKTEQKGVKIDAKGGKVELLGGFAYANSRDEKDTIVRATDAEVTVAGLMQMAFTTPRFKFFVKGTRKGVPFSSPPTMFFDAAH